MVKYSYERQKTNNRDNGDTDNGDTSDKTPETVS